MSTCPYVHMSICDRAAVDYYLWTQLRTRSCRLPGNRLPNLLLRSVPNETKMCSSRRRHHISAPCGNSAACIVSHYTPTRVNTGDGSTGKCPQSDFTTIEFVVCTVITAAILITNLKNNIDVRLYIVVCTISSEGETVILHALC